MNRQKIGNPLMLARNHDPGTALILSHFLSHQNFGRDLVNPFYLFSTLSGNTEEQNRQN